MIDETKLQALADDAGLFTQVTFEIAAATSFPGHRNDLIAYIDCLHDMGDPVVALEHAREALSADGTVLLVEPAAGEKVEENLNPVGRVYSGVSVLCCSPNAIAMSSAGKQIRQGRSPRKTKWAGRGGHRICR